MSSKFFLICLSHINLETYYDLNFKMIQLHHWSLTEIENMLPYEREVYLALLNEHVKNENKKTRLKALRVFIDLESDFEQKKQVLEDLKNDQCPEIISLVQKSLI